MPELFYYNALKISSVTKTPRDERAATMIMLLFIKATIRAIIVPTTADITDDVEQNIAGKVITESTA